MKTYKDFTNINEVNMENVIVGGLLAGAAMFIYKKMKNIKKKSAKLVDKQIAMSNSTDDAFNNLTKRTPKQDYDPKSDRSLGYYQAIWKIIGADDFDTVKKYVTPKAIKEYGMGVDTQESVEYFVSDMFEVVDTNLVAGFKYARKQSIESDDAPEGGYISDEMGRLSSKYIDLQLKKTGYLKPYKGK